MTYNLFLDDMRVPGDVVACLGREWIVVRSVGQAEYCVRRNGVPAFVSYDHDLMDRHYTGNYSDGETGASFAFWLTRYAGREVPFQVHSLNPDAPERIARAIALGMDVRALLEPLAKEPAE